MIVCGGCIDCMIVRGGCIDCTIVWTSARYRSMYVWLDVWGQDEGSKKKIKIS